MVIGHLLVTLARLNRPGGVRVVAAESLAVKHQLLIMERSRRRNPTEFLLFERWCATVHARQEDLPEDLH